MAMTNRVYQITVQELETVLSPRVVSRSLQEGLKQVGKTPETVAYDDIDKILKAYIYRQLQVALPVDKAKEKVKDVLARLEEVREGGAPRAAKDAEAPPPQQQAAAKDNALAQQQQTLDELREAIRPFNLYFEWPETQKLRAQLQLLEEEQEQGREAPQLVSGARSQLKTLEQKLEDQLVTQADELSKLETAYEQVEDVGGYKVRRLDKIIRQVRAAQEERQLATGEIDRAKKLVTELRKLLQSSVASEETPAAQADTDTEAEEGLGDLILDLSSERDDLAAIVKNHGNLLNFRPELAETIAGYEQQLDRDEALGDSLEQLRRDLGQAEQQLRQELQDELRGIKTNLANMDAELDTQELTMSLQVTLGVLENTLPPESDVKHIRDLHRLLEQRSAGLASSREQAQQAQSAKLEQQGEAITRLQATLERYSTEGAAVTERKTLQGSLERLEQAHQDGDLAPELLAEAQSAAGELEAAVAERAQGVLDKQRAKVRGLLSQVQALPLIDPVLAQARALEQELSEQLEQLEHEPLGDDRLDASVAMVDKLRGDLRAAYEQRISSFLEQASSLGNRDVLARIQEASQSLEQGNYPDLSELERSLAQASSERLSEQLADLHQLETEARQLRGIDTDEFRDFQTLLQDARQRLEQGYTVDNLERGWTLLERLQGEMVQRSASFEPRLDELLGRFEPVSKLNTDEATHVRRVLRYLDSQRGAFNKISPGMQDQLMSSLDEAEEMLSQLQEEFEATRAIAGQLVSGNVLDDVLGIFGDKSQQAPAPPPSQAAPPAKAAAERAPEVRETRSDNTALNRWLDAYLDERGVRDVAIFTPEGDLLSGRCEFKPRTLRAAIDELEENFGLIGEELGLGGIRLLSVEMLGKVLVVVKPVDDYPIAIVIDTPSVLSLVLNRLRRDIPKVSEILSGPAFA